MVSNQMTCRSSAGKAAAWLIVAAVAATAAAACSSGASVDANRGGASSTSPASTSTSSPPASPSPSPTSRADHARQLALGAYLGMWEDFVAAGKTSDWQSPRLKDHATGKALLALSRSLYADHYNKLVTKGRPKNTPEIASASPPGAPTTVMVSDCGDSTNWLKYKAATGELADDEPGGRQSIKAEVKRQTDGTWKVTRFGVWGVGTC